MAEESTDQVQQEKDDGFSVVTVSVNSDGIITNLCVPALDNPSGDLFNVRIQGKPEEIRVFYTKLVPTADHSYATLDQSSSDMCKEGKDFTAQMEKAKKIADDYSFLNQTDYVITKLAEEQATGDETSYKSDLEKYSEIITKRKAAREEIDALRKEE